MSTCATVNACTKSGFGNIESVCDFNVVGCAGKGEYFIGVAGRFCCCCCFCLLLSFLGVSSPWPLTFFASSFRPAVGLGVACIFAVLARCARCGFLFVPVAAMLPGPLFLTKRLRPLPLPQYHSECPSTGPTGVALGLWLISEL